MHLIAYRAIKANLNVRYHRLSNLLELIVIHRQQGTYRSFANSYKNIDLLVIDDFGLSPINLNASRELLDIIDDRVKLKSTIISSQYPIQSWYGLIEDKTVSDAIMDRLINSSISIELKGESMRKILSDTTESKINEEKEVNIENTNNVQG